MHFPEKFMPDDSTILQFKRGTGNQLHSNLIGFDENTVTRKQ